MRNKFIQSLIDTTRNYAVGLYSEDKDLMKVSFVKGMITNKK